MRTEDLGRYQMLWDCPFCGAEKLLGLDHRHCPGCGSAQDPDKRYYPTEGEEIAVEDHPFHGADRVCPACSTPNGALAGFCGNCGSALEEAAATQLKADQRPAATPTAPPTQPASGAESPDTPAAGQKSGKKGCLFFLVILVFVGFAAFCLMSTLWTKDAVVTVTGHSWARTVQIEKLGTATASAWKEDLPTGAKSVQCKKAVQTTKKVESGEQCETVRKDKGDGTYDKVKECKPTYKDQDVYGQKCSYQVEKWGTSRTAKAAGSGTGDAIAWPAVRLTAGEREGTRDETYTVNFKVKGGDSGSCNTSQKRWTTLKDGSSWTAKIGVISKSIDCDELSPR